jgi:hypothetical protein
VGSWLVERRLKQASARLRKLRDELRIIDEQLAHLADEAGDMGIRSLVAETPGAAHEYHHAQAHADAMAKHRAHVVASIAELEVRQDQLLDRL